MHISSLVLNKRRSAFIGALFSFIMPVTAHASEGGASFYLLGSGGPGAAVMPPLEGVYFDNTIYVYDASAKADRSLVIGGNVVAGVDLVLIADFATLLWVPSTDVLGGTLALGASLPLGAPIVDVEAIITGPRGRQVSVNRHDSALLVGDPVAAATLGWETGDLHIQAGATVNIPVGTYRDGQLANVSFHRWIVDTSVATTWNDPKAGWDISGKAGVTFNGTNEATDYKTGTEFHLEGSAEKSFSPAFSAGVQGYYFKQLSGDSGEGATLGPFKGEVAAVGVTAAINTEMAGTPATFRARVFKEFAATNRPEGNAFFLSFTMPLHMKMPAAQ